MARLPPQPFIPLAFAACAGIVVSNVFSLSSAIPIGTALALGIAAFFYRHFIIPFVAVAFMALHAIYHNENPGRELLQGAAPMHVAVQGIVLTDPSSNTRSAFQVVVEELDNAARSGRDRLLVRWQGATPSPGDRVRVEGTLRKIAPPRNPGEFDQVAWLSRQGIWHEIVARQARDCSITERDCAYPIRRGAYRCRRWLQQTMFLGLEDDPEMAGLIQSMVLGLDGGATSQEMKSLFRDTGTLHLFAVSGLNVAMLAGILWVMLKPLGLGQRIAAAISIPILVFYAYVTGLTPSGIRATIMLVIVLSGQILERPPLPLNTVAAAAFVILLCDTDQLFMPGFQLSFGVVLALILLSSRVQSWIGNPWAPDSLLPKRLWSPVHHLQWFISGAAASFIAVAFSAWIGSTPLGIWHFRMASPVSIAANLIAVPISFIILVCGVMACCAGLFSSWLASVFNNASWLGAKLLVWAMGGFATIPGGHFYVGMPDLQRTVAEITIFDLGGGGATAIDSQGHHWLVDCGAGKDARWTVAPFLQRRGVNRLSGLVLTHGDATHIGGGLDIMRAFDPETTLLGGASDRSLTKKRLVEAAKKENRSIIPVWAGSELRISNSVTARILFPPVGWNAGQADDQALALQIRAGPTTVLLMSDNGFVAERWLMENVADLRADILVAGQHGNDVSGTPEFLDQVQPRLVIIPHDPKKRSGDGLTELPTDCAKRNIQVIKQEETGSVTLRIKKDGFAAVPFIQQVKAAREH